MIAVDTNILVHAGRREMSHHAAAVAALTELAEGNAAWALPVFCVGEYIRVVSHPRLFSPPTSTSSALAQVKSLLASPSARLLMPGPRYLPLLGPALAASGASGNLVFDAQIAALCLESGATTLLTEDRDFSRFPGLSTRRLGE